MRRLRSEWRKDDWILVVLVGVVILLLTGSFLTFVKIVMDSLEPIDQLSTQFLTSIREDEYDSAFELLSEELQDELGDLQILRGHVLEFDAIPDLWTYDKHQIIDNVHGKIGGTVRQQNGERHDLLIQFVKIDGHWYISRFEWGQVTAP